MKILNTLFGNSIKILIGVVLAIIVIFLLRNKAVLGQTTEFRLFGSVEYPFWLWLLFSFIAGGLVLFISNFKSRRQLKKTISQQTKELSQLQAEVENHRNSNITNEAEITPESKAE